MTAILIKRLFLKRSLLLLLLFCAFLSQVVSYAQEPAPPSVTPINSTNSEAPAPAESPIPYPEPLPAPVAEPSPESSPSDTFPETGQQEESEAAKRFRLEFSGSASTLWTFINDNKVTGDQYTFNSNRLRLNPKFFYGSRLSGQVVYDLQAYTGNLVSSPFWPNIQNPQAGSYFNWTSGFKPANAVYLQQSVYRAYVTYDAGFVQATAGKQRIAWGVMRFWRPTDIMNTESPLQLEPGEILGLDALYVKSNLSRSSSLEAVAAPSRIPGQQITAGRATFSSGTYDFTVVGGRVRNNDMLGFTFDGYIGDGGFRGELIRITPPAQFGRPYYQWTVGGDYAFPGNLTLTLEYLNNGGALGRPIDPFFNYVPGFLTTRNRQLVGMNVTKQLTPLWRLDTFISYDIDGQSIAFAPRIYWDFRQNVDISAGTMLFKGKSGGEYSQYPNMLFMQMKYYF